MDELQTPDEELNFYGRHRFFLLIFFSIIISFSLVTISIAMYNSSGAAQLDLSRPGYKDVRSQAITNDNDFKTFPNTGSVTQKVIDEFESAYSKQSQKTQSVDAFGGDPLSPDALGISEETTSTQE